MTEINKWKRKVCRNPVGWCDSGGWCDSDFSPIYNLQGTRSQCICDWQKKFGREHTHTHPQNTHTKKHTKKKPTHTHTKKNPTKQKQTNKQKLFLNINEHSLL